MVQMMVKTNLVRMNKFIHHLVILLQNSVDFYLAIMIFMLHIIKLIFMTYLVLLKDQERVLILEWIIINQ